MPKKRKSNLGSGRIYHAKGARSAYKDAYQMLTTSLKHAKEGKCRKAYETLLIGNRDYAKFFTEFKHAVGSPAESSVMSAPKQRAVLRSLASEAFETVAKKCLR